MTRRRKIELLFALALVIAAGATAAQILVVGGFWRNVEPHFSGTCGKVAGIPGPEDIALDAATGIAYVSSVDRTAAGSGKAAAGGIYRIDLNRPGLQPTLVVDAAAIGFFPHGISLFPRTGKATRLFAILHKSALPDGGAAGHAVAIFDISETHLTLSETLKDRHLTSPNDIVAIGPREFYLTNDHGSSNRFFRALEDYLRLPWSTVVHYDGRRFRKSVSGLRFANGIAADADGADIYVASTTGRELLHYRRDASNGDLTLQNRHFLATGLDNLTIASDGAIWIGAHPKLLAFISHAQNSERDLPDFKKSPSQVLRLRLGGDGRAAIDEVYLDDGAQISGASVAVRYGDRLLIGSVFEEFLANCRLTSR